MNPALATIIMFAGNYNPKYWAFCSGQILSISQNTALFSLLGTTYGGNGVTTFALPDLRGRTPVHPGNGAGIPAITLGEATGTETTTILLQNLPIHTHTGTVNIAVSSANANTDEGAGNVPAKGAVNAFKVAAATNAQLGGVTTNVGISGSSQPIPIRQPYIGINFIICLAGVFPSRN